MPSMMPETKLDSLDLQILRILRREGRASNKDIATALDIPQSTCLLRVKRLVDGGVIRGFNADVDPAKLGRPLQAMVSVQLVVHSRKENDRFLSKAVTLPGVLSVSQMAGDDDYLLHVAAPDPESLSNFVLDNITSDPGVRGSHTRLVFKHERGVGN